mgnify:CR=1 FL=1
MKLDFLSKLFIQTLIILCTNTMQAQHSWAMATIVDEENTLSFTEYHSMPETGVNNIDYLRIYDESCRLRQDYYNPIKTQYGYRISDKHIFIYDFDTEKERLAFDFTLSEGDHFITYNEMEWKVEAVLDTLVNLSYLGTGKDCTKRLLKVSSIDGLYSDQWLEDFGSFSNHFMILPMSDAQQIQTLWMEYDYGCYLVREISADPLFTHYSGWPEDFFNNGQETESVNCSYKDGVLFVEDIRWRSPNCEYSCFKRIGDNISCAFVWELNPSTEESVVVLRKDIYFFTGLPEPQTGIYDILFNTTTKTSVENNITQDSNIYNINNKKESPIFDLHGHKLKYTPASGIYILNGKKFIK